MPFSGNEVNTIQCVSLKSRRYLFEFTLKVNFNRNISVAEKSKSIKTKGKGKIELDKCILNDVLHVPELNKNLLSINAVKKQ